MSGEAEKRALLERQIRNLFVVGESGRLVRVNEPNGGPPPLFYMGRSAEGCVAFVGAGTPEVVAERLLTEATSEPGTINFDSPAGVLEAVVDAARALGGEGVVRRGPGYAALEEPPEPAIDAVVAPAAGRRLHSWIAQRWRTERLRDLELAFGVIVDGTVVALCHCARLGRFDAEAGVETAEEYRHRGYATAATAAWVRAVRASGRMAFYSTDWENAGSRGVARRLGLTLLGELSSVI